MGIDLKAGGRVKSTARTKSLSTNPYIALLIKLIKNNKEGKISVVVGSVTDDLREMEVPKMRVCALKFTQKARTAQKYMGKAPGVPNSDTRPRVRSTGRKFE